MDARLLLTIDDAADLLSITPRRLARLERDGRVPSVRLGDGEVRYSADALREWVRRLASTEQPREAARA